jgi:hypothetical protein
MGQVILVVNEIVTPTHDELARKDGDRNQYRWTFPPEELREKETYRSH